MDDTVRTEERRYGHPADSSEGPGVVVYDMPDMPTTSDQQESLTAEDDAHRFHDRLRHKRFVRAAGGWR
jgi:hypothetical protein